MILASIALSLNIGVPLIELPKGTADAGRRPMPVVDARKPKKCFRKIGPFQSKGHAWEIWQQARGKRMRVSRGVFECPDSYGMAYCFRVYQNCR